MKKVLLMVVGLTMLATAAHAYGPAAYMGLYGDEARTVMEGMGVYTPFNMWVWINPSDAGVAAAEYRLAIEGDAGTFATPTENDAIITATLGNPFGGDGIAISTHCQFDWFWAYQIEIVLTNPSPSYVVILPTVDVGTQAQVASCGFPPVIEELFAINKFGLNQLGIVDNETSTWGAIKSLINE